jgi:type I restriction enzyme S subunit
MAKYKKYPEYKDTGVEWMGDIPQHWVATELKRFSSVQGGYAFSSNNFTDVGTPIIRIGDIKTDGCVSLESCKFVKTNSPEEHREYKINKGAILMAMTGATIGKAGQYKEGSPALLNQRVGSFKCDTKHLSDKFLWHLLNSSGYQEYIKLTAFGGAQPNISDSGMISYHSSLPPLPEQKQIARFLDHETGKIDRLILKQQQLIELLKEKRQAVISHAVTKGLNPNAPLKPSNIEWLGDVPEHWEVKRMKHISPKIGVGLVINPSTYTKDEGVYFIFGGDVKEYHFDLSKTRRISPKDSDYLLPSRLNHRDLVSIRVGFPGVTAVVTEDLEGSNCASVIIIRRGMYNSDWLCAAARVRTSFTICAQHMVYSVV